MKKLIALTVITFAELLHGSDMELALDAPVSVVETTKQTIEASVVKIRYIVINVPKQQVEVEIEGIEQRLVHQLTEAQFNNLRTTFASNYGGLLKAVITDHFAAQQEIPPE